MKSIPDDNELRVANLLRRIDEASEASDCAASSMNVDLDGEVDQLSLEEMQQLRDARHCLEALDKVRDLEKGSTCRQQPGTLPSNAAPHALATLPGKIGRFEIKRLLGQGGFARVFLAYDPVLGREVALKVPKPDALATDEARIRFEREARAAATLAHPAIIAVYEAGNVGPIQFISFAFCNGETLGDFIAKQKGRVDLKIAVAIASRLARGLSHAHSHGVVHRDIKPGNVLIEKNADSSRTKPLADRVRITDFGLVKVEVDGSDPTDDLTVDGAIIGTPAYMSPEQAQGQTDVGPATDIFSLGTILYQLLTGTLPHKKDSYLKTLKSIEEHEPKSPRVFRRELPRDLEAVVLKCLNKQPADRYESAFALAEDLDDWLGGRPVQARPVNSIEKLWRTVRRNPGVSAAIAVAFMGVASGMGVAIWQWKNAVEKTGLVEAANKDKDFEIKRARDSLESLIVSFQAVDPFQGGEPNLSAIEVLLRTYQQIDQKFKDDPETKIELLTALARSFTGVGDFKTALECRRRIYDLLGMSKPDTDPAMVEAFRALAVAEHNAGNLLKSLELREELLTLTKQNFGESHPDTILAMTGLGKTYMEMGQIRKAVDLQEQTSVLVEMNGRSHELSNTVSANLAAAYQSAKLLKRAIEVNRKELAECERLLGPDHPDTITVKASLAGALNKAKKHDEAVKLQNSVLARCRTRFGADAPETFEQMAALSTYQLRGGQFQTALETMQRTCELAADTLGREHPRVILFLDQLGLTHRWVGDLDSAAATLESALDSSKSRLGANDYRTIQIMIDLSRVYHDQHDNRQSIKYAKRSVENIVSQVGHQHLLAIEAKSRLARCYLSAYELEKAKALLGEILQVMTKQLGHGHVRVVSHRRLFLYAVMELNEFAAIESAINKWAGENSKGSNVVQQTLLAMALIEQKKFGKARQLVRELSQRENLPFPGRSFIANMRGHIHGQNGKYKLAENWMVPSAEKLLARFDELEYPHHRSQAVRAIERTALMFESSGDSEMAEVWNGHVTEINAILSRIRERSRLSQSPDNPGHEN